MSGQTRERLLPVGVLVLGGVAAHERVDERDVHRLGGGDDVPEVADDLGRGAPGPDGAGWGSSRAPRSRGPCRRSRRRARSPGSPRGSPRRCAMVPAYRRVGPLACGQQAISMLSKPLAAVQSATSISGVSGNGAVSRPSLIGRCASAFAAPTGDRIANDVDPAAESGALGDRVVDEHLVVAVGEGRIGGPCGRATGGDVRVDRPEEGGEGVAEALHVAARAARRRRDPRGSSAPGS